MLNALETIDDPDGVLVQDINRRVAEIAATQHARVAEIAATQHAKVAELQRLRYALR